MLVAIQEEQKLEWKHRDALLEDLKQWMHPERYDRWQQAKEAREKAETHGIKSVSDAMGFSRENRAYEEQLRRVRINPDTGRAEYVPTPEEQARVERAAKRMRELDEAEGRRVPVRKKKPGSAAAPQGGSFTKMGEEDMQLVKRAEEIALSGRGGAASAALASLLRAARGEER